MPTVQQCPMCNSRLRIPDSVTAPFVTCPRCLERVPNPGVGTPAPVSATPSPPTPAPESSPAPAAAALPVPLAPEQPPAPGTRKCPTCGHAVDPHWAACPLCLTRLHESFEPRWASSADEDVHGDTQRMGCGLIGLMIIGGLALARTVLVGLGMFATGQPRAALGVLGGICLLVLLGIFVAWLRSGDQPAGAGRILYTTLAVTGGIVIGVAGLALAGFVLLLAVCISGGMRGAFR